LPKVSMAIPEWNGGLLVAKNTEQFRAFVKSWNALFNQCLKRGYGLDQASFRSALAISRLRVATLAHNYNFRAHVQQIVRGQVRILHAHGELDEIAKTVNATPVMRHYVPQENLIHGYRPPKASDL
jgi:hypothetical protein